MLKHKVGLVSVSFRKHSPLEILREMQKCSLSLIEWGSDIHAPCTDEKHLCELLKMQNEYGACCCSYGTYFRLGITDVSELERYINAAKILGTDILRIWCGDKRHDKYTADEKKAFVEVAVKAAEIAQNNGVFLCMECHNNTYTETLCGALEIMNAVDSENFRMYWQPNQFVDFDENIEYAKQISDYVKNVHVFNWNGREKYPLSQGIDMWQKYLGCFDKPKKLLLEFMPDDRIESLEEEAKALFEIIG